ncbi:MAG: glycosyl hydrolase family 65 protein [Rhodopila sp.]|nr:glycosyl hydrolase family 65 protein [Rhodopila sp.]
MTRSVAMEHILEPTADPAWVLESEGYDPLRESNVESRFAISNGFLGIRGGRSTTRGARWVVPARTYVAGLFDTPGADRAVPGLVPAADWLQVRILLSGAPMVHHPGDVSSHRMTLDMRRGALLSQGHHFKSPDLRVRVRTLRLVSLSERAVGLQLIQFEIEEGTLEVTFEAAFEGMNLGLVSEQIEQDLGVWRTQHSGKGLAMATASSLRIDGHDLPPAALGQLKSSWSWTARPGQLVCFERAVAIVRSDTEALNPGTEAREKLGLARHVGWRGVVAAHEAAWASRWQSSEVEVEGDAAAQLVLRFALYHLNSAANPADERVSIGARALTGDVYHGHVFWDTEIFLLPFYVLTWPDAARALLMYRFHTLDAARAKAVGMGWRGALYAWESADTGVETTPEQVIAPDHRVIDVLCGKQEQHISADVAYAVWQYWQATGDDEFLRDAGAEIILETGRFWSSRAQPEADGYCHIRGVIGPDEYHQNIDDNAFTNVMARWNIRRALDVAALLRERWPVCWTRLSSRLGLDEAELKRWLDVAETMATGLDPETGLFEQFAGYFALEDIDLTNYAGRSVPIDIVIGRERTQKSQVVKQADVVALLCLLPEEFAHGAAAENFRYYEPRCSHGSSLSPAMHGLVAARLGDAEMALRFFRQTAAIDLSDTHVAIDGGVHIGALGGIWMLAVFGFAGLSLRNDGIVIDAKLPAGWRSLAFGVQWRRRHLRIRIDQDKQRLEATLESGEPMILVVRDEPHELRRDQALRVFTGRP